MTTLEDLPNEVLEMVVCDEDLSTHDYLALALTNKRINTLVTPCLFYKFSPPNRAKVVNYYQTCIGKFRQFCAMIRGDQFYARQVDKVKLPATVLSQIAFHEFLTCSGLDRIDLRLRECTMATLKTFSALLKSITIPVVTITRLTLAGSFTDDELVTKTNVFDFLLCISITLPKLLLLGLPDFHPVRLETSEILKALEHSKSLRILYLENPITCSAIVTENQIPSLREIHFRYRGKLSKFVHMINSNNDRIGHGWLSMMERGIMSYFLVDRCRQTRFQHLVRYAIRYLERNKIQGYEMLRYLVAAHPDIQKEYLGLVRLTSSQRDMLLTILLEDRPPESHHWGGVVVSLYSTDHPWLPLPESIKTLTLSIRENLSPNFIPTLIARLPYLERLAINFGYENSLSKDNQLPALEVVGGCTHSCFTVPSTVKSDGFFDPEEKFIRINQRHRDPIRRETVIDPRVKISRDGKENYDWYEEMRGWIQDRPSLRFYVALRPDRCRKW